MRKNLGFAFLTLTLACSASQNDTKPTPPIGDGETTQTAPGGGAERSAPPGAVPEVGSGTTDKSGGGAGGAGGSGSVPTPGSGTAGQGGGQAGLLTAGVWDDRRNFDRFLSYLNGLAGKQLSGLLPVTTEELQAARTRFAGVPAAKATLDVTLVVDTTGSMADELSYLQTEFLALSASIRERYPNAEQHWALVFYRDTTDAYIVRWFDFRSEAEELESKLAAQSATGGGDMPEAVDQALGMVPQLTWRGTPSTARLVFWVADAPHHAERAEATATAIRAMQAMDVHVYPVAASGVDELGEATMRTAALLTGGRYIFLTDDSGVGGAHKEPTIPCYFVTQLDQAILRMVDIEMSGVYREPDAKTVIRTGGDPQNGACTLASGENVKVY